MLNNSKILLTIVKNPFEPLVSREIKELDYREGGCLKDYLIQYYGFLSDDFEYAIAVNGKVVDDAYCVQPGDSIVVVPELHGGGGGGGDKNPVATIATIALIVVATVATYGASSWALTAGYSATAATAIGAAAGAAVSIAGGMLINSILPPPTPDLGSFGGLDWGQESPTYSWSVAGNTFQEGGALPVVYGTVRVTPYLIGKYVSIDNDKQYLNLLYAVSDGPIDSISDIEINGNPIENYDEIEVETRLGTNDQDPIRNFSDTFIETQVGFKLPEDGSYTAEFRGATNEINALNVVLVFPQGIYYANDSGGLDSIDIEVAVQYKKVGDTIWHEETKTITRATRNPVYEIFRFQDLEPGQYEIKAYYVSETHTDNPRYSETCYISYIQEIIYDDFAYPNTALLAIRALATDQLSGGLPRVTCLVERNYVEVYRDALIDNIHVTTYSGYLGEYRFTCLGMYEKPAGEQWYIQGGDNIANIIRTETDIGRNRTTMWLDRSIWDWWSVYGPSYLFLYKRITPTTKKLSNPASACFDILTNKRYGCGVDENRINLSEFEDWAQYCEDNNLTCNICFDQTLNISKALNEISQLGMAVIVQRGTSFGVIIDRPSEPVQMFTMGNIIAGSFKETFLAKKERIDALDITYFDKEKNYSRQTIELRQESFATIDEAVNKKDIVLYGCTDKDLTIKYGRRILNGNKYLNRTISFEAEVDAIACQPGDVILFQHDVPQWGYGGRILNSGDYYPYVEYKWVQLDRSVEIDKGSTYKLMIRHSEDDVIEEVPVNTIDDIWTMPDNALMRPSSVTQTTIVTDILYYKSGRTASKDDVYNFNKINKVAKPFRVTKIDRTQELQCKITALEYYDEFYDDLRPTIINFSSLTTIPEISNVNYYETVEGDNYTIFVDWQNNENVSSVDFTVLDGNQVILEGETAGTFLNFNALANHTYIIQLQPKNELTETTGRLVEFEITEHHEVPEEEPVIVPTYPTPNISEVQYVEYVDKDVSLYGDEAYRIRVSWTADVNTDYVQYQIVHNGDIVKSDVTEDTFIEFYIPANETYTVSLTPVNRVTVSDIVLGETRTIEITEHHEVTTPILLPTHRIPTPEIIDVRWNETMERHADGMLNKINVSWTASSDTDFVRYRLLHDRSVIDAGEATIYLLEFYIPTSATYKLRLTPINRLNDSDERIGETKEIIISEYMQGQPPSDITDIRCDILDRQVHLSWSKCDDLDFHHYLVVCGPLTHPYNMLETTSTELTLPITEGEHEFHVFAVDFLGNRSVNPASVSVDVAGFFVQNVIIEQDVDLSTGTFAGAICFTSASELRRPSAAGSEVFAPYMESENDCDALTVAANWEGVTADELADITADQFKNIDPAGSGVWESEIIDLGDIFEGYFQSTWQVDYVKKTLDDLLLPASAYAGIYPQDFIDNGTIRVTCFVSQDGSKWLQTYSGGHIKARYLKYRVEMDTRNPLYEFKLSNLKFTLDVPDITDGGKATVTDTQTVSYNKSFHHVRTVNFTTFGDTDVDLVDYDENGFTVTVVGGGTATISWQAQGY